MNILSFDCANRSLAVCFMTININIMKELTKAQIEKNINLCIDLINNYAIIHITKVYDLTKGKKIDTVTRLNLLKKCLTELDSTLQIVPDYILVEYQMSANDKSRCISNGIVYHYCNQQVILVGPSLKNKVWFSDNLKHGVFMAKYSNKYTANKNHTKANFLYWLKIYDLEHLISENKIAKKNIDDIADAFMQVWGWLESKSHFVI